MKMSELPGVIHHREEREEGPERNQCGSPKTYASKKNPILGRIEILARSGYVTSLSVSKAFEVSVKMATDALQTLGKRGTMRRSPIQPRVTSTGRHYVRWILK